ncbi:MAG: dephospho-CoA kinase [Tepidisphaera sp.]|nr:dephospho-CoA kinase [Tepidisphaera sp.]
MTLSREATPGSNAAHTERVILDLRPGASFIIAWAWPSAAAGAAIGAVIAGLGWVREGVLAGIILIAGALGWAAVVALCRRYILTDRHASVRLGVIRRVVVEVPLANLQHVTMTRSVLERLLGAGSIAIASAGTDGYALVWRTVDRPEGVLALVRAAAQGRGLPPPSERFMVIGLVGGIGAGKSAVAKAFEGMGFLVVDSDKEAKEALDRPEVRAQLVSWWGQEILTPEGRVDRSKVAKIIFADASQRARLEGLVHPLVKAGRAAMAADARRAGKKGVIVDAPLLFEAGVDKECDFVLFVDAPRELRLERVRARGWDEAELERREKAQISLQQKRTMSDAVVENVGTLEDVRRQVEGLVAVLAARAPRVHARQAPQMGPGAQAPD